MDAVGPILLALVLLQQLLLLPVAAQAAISKDLVQALPGLAAELPSRLWSGYIEPSPGHMLHYVFMESWSDRGTAEEKRCIKKQGSELR